MPSLSREPTAPTSAAQVQRLAADMVALCGDPGDVPHALDLLNASYAPPQLPADADSDDAYLHHRIRTCHDGWHAISGCPTNFAGEAAHRG